MGHHHHQHGQGHSHHHAPANYGWAFAVGITLNLSFVVLEVIYGRLSHSLSLVADAGHNLSDVMGLVLAWGARMLARRRPTSKRTYGFRRSSILAALINAVVLLVSVGAIAWEAIHRLGDPHSIAGTTVVWVAMIGVVINIGTALMFMSGRKGDLNIRGAFMHMTADAVIALGVAVSGAIILFTGWVWLDPLVSLVIVGLIVIGTWSLLRDSINLVLDGVPAGIDLQAVNQYLANLPDCVEVHDLHIWGMSTTETALTAHLVLAETMRDDTLLVRTARELHDQFGIEHTTLQLETGKRAGACGCQLLTS